MTRHVHPLHQDDLRYLPAYSIPEAARYVGVPVPTVRSWVLGRAYPTREGAKRFQPLIEAADRRTRRLSFVNLVEVHVLSALRKEHRVRLSSVRTAIRYLGREFDSRHPLVDQKLETHGGQLFVERYGQLINVSREGQLAMKAVLESYLRRVERDTEGMPIRLYPFTRPSEEESPRSIVIDPLVSFGRPVLVGTGIRTSVVADRYKAGDSIRELADDYGRTIEEIEEAIRVELAIQAA